MRSSQHYECSYGMNSICQLLMNRQLVPFQLGIQQPSLVHIDVVLHLDLLLHSTSSVAVPYFLVLCPLPHFCLCLSVLHPYECSLPKYLHSS